jgi:hypothetical protein
MTVEAAKCIFGGLGISEEAFSVYSSDNNRERKRFPAGTD